MMRQIVLDTETTGLSAKEERIIEIGAIELIDRKITENTYHVYINPEKEVSLGAQKISGLTWKKLRNKPKFSEIVDEFLLFLGGDELVIHNAVFDLNFIIAELERVEHHEAVVFLEKHSVIDTLELARKLYPGKKNDLDSLCQRHSIDITQRVLHGALMDSQLLAQVYLKMTSGQVSLLDEQKNTYVDCSGSLVATASEYKILPVEVNLQELKVHQEYLIKMRSTMDKLVWDEYAAKAH